MISLYVEPNHNQKPPKVDLERFMYPICDNPRTPPLPNPTGKFDYIVLFVWNFSCKLQNRQVTLMLPIWGKQSILNSNIG